MPRIVRFHETGGADVLKVEDLPLTEPSEGEVRLKVEAIGLNRADAGVHTSKPIGSVEILKAYTRRTSGLA